LSEALARLATERRTARKFADRPVNQDDVLYCIEVATQAPSGANRQPWRFVVIDDPKLKEKVRTICEQQEKLFHENVEEDLREWFKRRNITWQKPFLTEAPVLVAVFSNRKMPYAIQSTWLAVGYMLLALEERSLATVTYTPSYPERVRQVFGASDEYRIEVILPIGYSADTKPKEKRLPIESLAYKNGWEVPTGT
jgi:nitroreductase